MASDVPLKDQLQRNLVAVISLLIAVSSLHYNTWRNEKTGYNRDQRLASLEVLLLFTVTAAIQ